jgi:hypothetical protein
MIAERLAAARAELRIKSKSMIDTDAAATWGARAVAAFELYRSTKNFQHYSDAIEFAHEACEHSAGGPPGTLEHIRAELSQLTGGHL